MSILIKGATILNGDGKKPAESDLFIKDGVIEDLGAGLKVKAEETIEAKGLSLLPGFIDLQTQFREPGFEAKETVQTGAKAAIRGGYVASVSMPNTVPACDHIGVIDNILRKAREVPYHVFPAATISKGREGKELSEMADLKNAGIVAVTDANQWVNDSLLMRRALEYASMLDLLVISHCEDRSLSGRGVMNESLMSTKLGLFGIPAASEDVAVARDLELARLTGAHLHIVHVSTARSVELIRQAKKEGVKVTADVTPYNLVLTEQELEGYNTNMKVYPPLRSENDRIALKEGLKDGTIDCIATNHSPHTAEDKMAEFDQAPFGSIGLETTFSVVMTELVEQEGWKLQDVVKVMSTNAASILKLDDSFGKIKKGAKANVALVDPKQKWTIAKDGFISKSRNCCFINREVTGKVTATVCDGKLWRFG